MRHCPSILSFCYLLAACGFVHAAEKPQFLATFDPAVESIQLEFENQAEPGCFWGPYKVRDALLEEMENLGIKTSESSLFVLSIVTWGAATDDYHCAVLVETELRKFGVRAETSEDEWIGIDLLVWDDSELLTGPKVHMDDRIHDTVVGHMAEIRKAIDAARR